MRTHATVLRVMVLSTVLGLLGLTSRGSRIVPAPEIGSGHGVTGARAAVAPFGTTRLGADPGTVAGRQPSDRLVPQELTGPEWEQLRRATEEAEYRPVAVSPGGDRGAALVAQNPRQGFSTRFGVDGVRLEARDEASSWRLPVRLAEYGYAGAMAPVPRTEPTASGDRVEYRRPGIVEWYVNRPSGLEQGFTLEQAPPGPANAGAEVRLALEVGGGFLAVPRGSAAVLREPARGAEIRYDRLAVEDAAGERLPARILVEGGRVVLAVDTRSAEWPITVDPTFTQQQQLRASDGAAGDRFGVSVSVDGDSALVGSYQSSRKGAAYVYVRAGGGWSQQAKLEASDGAAGDYFGYSVSIDGDTAVVGASEKGSAQGAAYVFVRSGGAWTEQQKLLASDGERYNYFGTAVSVDGDTAVVGAMNNDLERGAAYVFVRSGGTWTEQQKLVASDGASGDLFGFSAAISGDTAVIGAHYKDRYSGAVYVYARSGDTWTEQAKLMASDSAEFSLFGASVSIDGDMAIVGASAAGGSERGAAYVFLRSGETWTEQQKLVASDIADLDCFGFSAAISGDTAVVGALGKDSDRGAVYVFLRSGTTWVQEQKLVAPDGAAGDRFGVSASVSGDTALVGSYGKDGNRGAVYAYVVPAPPPTRQKATLLASDGAAGDTFGQAVSVSGETAVVGAPQGGQGAAYVYLRSGGSWTEQAKLTASDGGAGDKFGEPVSLSGDTVIIGASGLNGAYVFVRSGTTWTEQAKLVPSDGAAGNSGNRWLAVSGDTAILGVSGLEAAYVFVRSGTTWTEQAKLVASDGVAGDTFGAAVSVSGDTVVVGAAFKDAVQGAAYAFVRSGTTWSEHQKLAASGGLCGGGQFGTSVGASGDTVLVGARGCDAAYVYQRSGTTWTEQARLVPSDPAVAFGYSVAISGDNLIVGTPWAPSYDSARGASYVFVRSGTAWTEERKLVASDSEPGDHFGRSVALSGDTAVIGAAFKDVNGDVDRGVAYVFVPPPPPTTTLTSSVNPSTYGQAVTFTAAVREGGLATGAELNGAATPSGTVQFTLDGDSLGFVSLSEGEASLTMASLAPGAHSVGATYSGDTSYSGSSAVPLIQNVTAASGVMTTPAPGTTLSGGTETFSWSAGSGVTEYWLSVGSWGAGSGEIRNASAGTSLSAEVSGLPLDGRTVYVRLWSKVSGLWQYHDYTYVAFDARAVLTTPEPGTTLAGSAVVFGWTAGSGASAYWLSVGTTSTEPSGPTNLYNKGTGTATSVSVSGLPQDGSTIFVRLWTNVDGRWAYRDYSYTAATAVNPAVVWTNVVGATTAGGDLTKTAGTGWGNAGAVSTKQLASGDGYMEFGATGGALMAGLGAGDADQGYADIEYAVFIALDNSIQVYESGILRGSFGTHSAGNRYRVVIEGGVVKYRRNGTLFYTSTMPLTGTYPLRADAALYSVGSQVQGALIEGTFVAPQAPVANPGGPYTGGTGIPVQFDGSGSTDADGTIVSYAWDFGDARGLGNGGAEPGARPTHTYEDAGTYTVTLTVTDNDGLTHSASTTATITLVDAVVWRNVVGAVASVPTVGAGKNLGAAPASSLTKTAATGWGNAGGVSSRQLSSGDGFVEFGVTGGALMAGLGSGDSDQGYADIEWAVFIALDNSIRIYESGVPRGGAYGTNALGDRYRVAIEGGVVKYRKNGTLFYTSTVPPAGKYPLRLDASLYSVGSQVQSAVIQGTFAEPQAPVANAGGPYSGATGIPVQFDGSGSADADGAIVSYAWDFGDAVIGYDTAETGARPTHTYTSAGSYTVTLTVTDDDGLTHSASTTATITLVDLVAWTNVVGAAASGASLTKTAACGWGNAGGVSTRQLASGDGFVEFGATGGSLMAGLGTGDVDQGYADIEYAVFIALDNSVRVYEAGVPRGDSYGTHAPGDRYRVSIEGGVVKYRRNGAVLYSSLVSPAGKYPLRLDAALYSAGAQVAGAAVQGTFAEARAPIANPGGPYTGGAGLPLQFNGGGASNADLGTLSYEWSFGDGGTGTGPSPTHVYDTAGAYEVALTVTNSDGLSATATTVATVMPVEAVAWTNVVGADVSGGKLTKTAGTGWGNAGAVSTRQLLSGEGFVEFGSSGGAVMAGLGTGDTDQGYADIEYAVFVALDNELRVYESGELKGSFGYFSPGDRLRVGIEGGVVKYWRNGVVFHESQASPVGKYPLRVDAALYSTGARVEGAVVQGAALAAGAGVAAPVAARR